MSERDCSGNDPRLSSLGQVGVVVRDIQKAVNYYSSVFGIGPFDIYDFRPQRAWSKGKEVGPIKLKIAMADLGPVKFELIEVLEGELPHREFLETHVEGLQHLGFYSDKYDEWKSYAKEKGMEILCEAEVQDDIRGKRRGFYMDSGKIGGVIFEIIEV
jgi:catechol 2,3-dioxygenase-like lactoylglutathione lyase family enzyme